MRAIQYSGDIDDGTDGPRRTRYPHAQGMPPVWSTDPPYYAATEVS
jgi:hypothetical protein